MKWALQAEKNRERAQIEKRTGGWNGRVKRKRTSAVRIRVGANPNRNHASVTRIMRLTLDFQLGIFQLSKYV